jgi:hypothetical protein
MSRTRWFSALLILVGWDAGHPRDALAQRYVLELRPRFGDTLRLRLDQKSEVSGSRQGGTSTKQIITTLSMFSRAIVEHSTPAAAVILAITDSVTFTSTDERTIPLVRATQAQLTGRQMRLRLAPDGTVTLADDVPRVAREVAELVSVMPASFPRASVAIGDTWLREVPIPPAASFGVPLGGVVKAAFRLDSVSTDGHNAYLTLRGTVVQPGSTPADKGMITGSLNGNMIVDRHRGWLSESRFLVQMRTTVTPVGAPPMDFRVKVTQHMRVIER